MIVRALTSFANATTGYVQGKWYDLPQYEAEQYIRVGFLERDESKEAFQAIYPGGQWLSPKEKKRMRKQEPVFLFEGETIDE